MLDRQQYHDQGTRENRKRKFQTVKGYWIALLAAGLVFPQLSPVFARNSFNNPIVPFSASQGAVSQYIIRPSKPARFTGRMKQSNHYPALTRRVRRSVSGHRSRHFVPPRHQAVFPSKRSRSWKHRAVRAQRRLARGRLFTTLPLGYTAMMLSNNHYYYHSGNFYRKAAGGYMTVDAPVGAVVPVLPSGYSFFLVDGVRYCSYEGQYYLPVSGGYRVVSDPRYSRYPRYTVSQPLISNQVRVTSDRLNVRSGPGLQYYTAGMVYQGDILQVLRRNVDWLYVRLPDNNRGWIMTRFTAPTGRRADG